MERLKFETVWRRSNESRARSNASAILLALPCGASEDPFKQLTATVPNDEPNISCGRQARKVVSDEIGLSQSVAVIFAFELDSMTVDPCDFDLKSVSLQMLVPSSPSNRAHKPGNTNKCDVEFH